MKPRLASSAEITSVSTSFSKDWLSSIMPSFRPVCIASGIWCGSMYGNFRTIIGVENSAYLLMDDEPLFDEILATYGELAYRNIAYILEHVGGVFDFAHYWEDICFKNGPLVNPRWAG